MGNMHVTTFDEYSYSFNAPGVFVLSASTSLGRQYKVQVDAEAEDEVVSMKTVSIFLPEDQITVQFSKDGKPRVRFD